MAYSVFFCVKYIFAVRDIVNGANPSDFVEIGDAFLTTQIVTWCVWTLTEAWYVYVCSPIHHSLIHLYVGTRTSRWNGGWLARFMLVFVFWC